MCDYNTMLRTIFFTSYLLQVHLEHVVHKEIQDQLELGEIQDHQVQYVITDIHMNRYMYAYEYTVGTSM